LKQYSKLTVILVGGRDKKQERKMY